MNKINCRMASEITLNYRQKIQLSVFSFLLCYPSSKQVLLIFY